LYIKKLEQAMKETAVDCLINLNANIFGVDYSRECNYTLCKYDCNNNVPDSMKDLDESQMNLDTYDIQFSASMIRKTEHLLHKIFRLHFVYELNDIVDEIHKQDRTIKDIFIYEALNRFIGKSGSFKPKIVVDKYGREGIIINRGIEKNGTVISYYMFQPVDLFDKSVPYSQRSLPILKKPKTIVLSSVEDVKRKRVTQQIDDKKLQEIMVQFINELIKPSYNDEMNTLFKYQLNLTNYPDIINYMKTVIFVGLNINEYKMCDLMLYIIMNFNRLAPINQAPIFEKFIEICKMPEDSLYVGVIHTIINILLYYLSKTLLVISNTDTVMNVRNLSELYGHNILGKYRKLNTETLLFENYVITSRIVTEPFLKYKIEKDKINSSRITHQDKEISNEMFGYSLIDKKGMYKYKLFRKLRSQATLSGATIDKRKQSKGIVCVTALIPEITEYLKDLIDILNLEGISEDYVKTTLKNDRSELCVFTEYLFIIVDILKIDKRSYFYVPEVELVNKIITSISKRT